MQENVLTELRKEILKDIGAHPSRLGGYYFGHLDSGEGVGNLIVFF